MKQREFYIDNLRILLTCLVVLHHLAITYGAAGTWYYIEDNTNAVSVFLLTLFTATNQAFFMGMFFMISAFFLDKSCQKKPTAVILRDKFKRLGIPYIIYILIVSPVILYLIALSTKNSSISVMEFIATGRWTKPGPLWFNSALLIFTVIALMFRNKISGKTDMKLPGDTKIAILAVTIGICSFLVRTIYPVSTSIPFIGFQLAHFCQYIILFYAGLKASQNNWFNQISYKRSIKWFKIVAVLIIIPFPLGFYLGGALEKGTDMFLGGFTVQSLFFAVWEQVVGFGIIIGLIGLFKAKFNRQNTLQKKASDSAYTVFIIHAFVLVVLSLLIRDVNINSTAKFLIMAPVVLIISFILSNILRRLPYFRQVL